jgi:hypothetical protein
VKNRYEIRGDIAIVYVPRPKHGDIYEVVIDANNLSKLDHVIALHMKATKKGETYVTCYTKPFKGKYVFMPLHRLITDAPKGTDVDHINGNHLDNRECNLRVVSHKENCQNKNVVWSSSGLRGVHYDKNRNKYQANVIVDGKRHYLGSYNTIEEAHTVVSEFRRNNMPYSKDAI